MSLSLPSAEEVKSWTVEQVYQWLKPVSETAAEKLKKEEVDGDALLQFEYRDFYYLQIPAGPRRKILGAIAESLKVERPVSASFLPTNYKPYTYLKNLITPEDVPKIREFYAASVVLDDLKQNMSYSKVVLNDRFYLPSLEKRLGELFPDMMVFATNYFSGDKIKGEYSGWHTGTNLSKLFIGSPNTCTVWIPLQDLTSETGGRLWFYNGEYLDDVVDLLKVSKKATMLFQYLMLDVIEDELEKHKVTEDCKFQDGFMFWEINPHCVDRECVIPREVLSVRLISKDAVIDEAILAELEAYPDDRIVHMVENKKMMASLLKFLTDTKKSWETSWEIIKQQEKDEVK